MLQGYICEVEVHILQKQVGGDKNVAVGRIVENSAVVAHGIRRGVVHIFKTFGDAVNQPEFAELRYFCFFFRHNYKLNVSNAPP